jgi:hypothetical protein
VTLTPTDEDAVTLTPTDEDDDIELGLIAALTFDEDRVFDEDRE